MISFDELDRRILAALQVDATVTNQALALRVFASPATTLRRVRTLTESGAIQKTVAILSPESVGELLIAISEITLSDQHAEAFDAFERGVVAAPEVTQCYRTAPSVDFTLVLTLTGMAQYNALVQRLFSATNNVRNVRTRFATKRSKFSTEIPLPSRN
ncbi:MAG: Lrp/AsnC family transcriptional regulator [Betaproteobacteria bacterium]|nr:MAG: Lrp/AsnC family transcriptional regulator [Betaproteobacteria bacterium]